MQPAGSIGTAGLVHKVLRAAKKRFRMKSKTSPLPQCGSCHLTDRNVISVAALLWSFFHSANSVA